jgi:uncharacterized protein YndB with AHSA1/START domain
VRVEESVEIARPPQEVWNVIVDPLRDPEWCAKVESVEPVSERRWRVIHKPVPLRPAVELTVDQLELDPPRHLRLREEDAASVFDVEYRLEPSGAGTCFVQVSNVEWKSLPRILHGTFRRGVRRDVRNQLRALKGLVEG